MVEPCKCILLNENVLVRRLKIIQVVPSTGANNNVISADNAHVNLESVLCLKKEG